MIGYIYLTYCSASDTYYVGKHTYNKIKIITDDKYVNLIKNFEMYKHFPAIYIDPNYIGSGKLLNRAIKKYGRKFFYVMDVLDIADTIEELNLKEAYWISEYRGKGVRLYNIADGGDGGDMISKLSESDRIKLKQKHRDNVLTGKTPILKYSSKPGKLNGMYGKKHTEESKLKNRLAHLGKKHTQETRDKMKASHNPNNKPPNNNGKIHIYKKDRGILINPEDFIQYECQGWVRESCVINNKNISKRVAKNYAYKYIEQGWVYGKLQRKSTSNN